MNVSIYGCCDVNWIDEWMNDTFNRMHNITVKDFSLPHGPMIETKLKQILKSLITKIILEYYYNELLKSEVIYLPLI